VASNNEFDIDAGQRAPSFIPLRTAAPVDIFFFALRKGLVQVIAFREAIFAIQL